jgi:hypothetical protein
MVTAAGSLTEPVYTWVYMAGVTDAEGAGAGLTVEVGLGAEGTLPDEVWSWTSAAYLMDKDGLSPGDLANDEYQARMTAPSAPGTYAYAGRVRAGAGRWTLCDLGDTCGGSGSDDGYDPSTAGALTVD